MPSTQHHYFVSYQIVGKGDSDLNGVGYREVFLAKPIRGIDDVNLVAGYLDLKICEEQGLQPGSITVVILNWQLFERGDAESNWLTGGSARNGQVVTAKAMDDFDLLRHKDPPEGWIPCVECNGAAVVGRDGSACVCAIYGKYPGWMAPPKEASDGS